MEIKTLNTKYYPLNTAGSHCERGYIALMSAIIIAAVLLIVAFSVSYSSFSARFNLLDSYNKETSYQLAETCINLAVLQLISDSNDLAPGSEIINSQTCNFQTIEVINPGVSYRIKSTSIVNRAHSNIEAEYTLPPTNTFTSWKEVSQH